MHDAVMYTILPFYRWNKFKKLMTLLKNMCDLDITIPMTWKSWSAIKNMNKIKRYEHFKTLIFILWS